MLAELDQSIKSKDLITLVQPWTLWNFKRKKASQFNQQPLILNGTSIVSISLILLDTWTSQSKSKEP